MKQKIIKPGVVRRIAEKIADEGINIPKETVDICLTAFLDTVADILSEGDSVADMLKSGIFTEFIIQED